MRFRIRNVRKAFFVAIEGGFVLLTLFFFIQWYNGRQEPLPTELPSQPDVEASETVTPPPMAAGENPRLRIEKIGVDMPIVEGKDESALLPGAWRSPFGSTPDKGGNTAIFGHRWLHKPPHPETFYDLDKFVVGDMFTVDWEGKRYTYRVTETLVVNPKDVWVLDQTREPTVTLITCTPLYSTAQRLVIRATLTVDSG